MRTIAKLIQECYRCSLNFHSLMINQKLIQIILDFLFGYYMKNMFIGVCPKGKEWVEYKNRCYGFFVNNHDRVDFWKAQEKCRSFVGGDLVSILNNDENQFIAKKIIEINSDLNPTDGNQYYYPWIGLNVKRKCGGMILFLINRQNHTYQVFSRSQPRC